MQGIDLSIISVIIGIFVGLGTLIAGCGFAYAQFKTGGDKAKDDLIETLKETATAEKAEKERLAEEKVTLVNSHQQQLNDLNNKIGELTGLYKAAEQSRQEYLKILQGRDPAQQAFMELVTKAAQQSNEVTAQSQKYMVDTIEILGEIRTFMKNLNESSSANRQFLSEVAHDTKIGEGETLRKKTV